MVTKKLQTDLERLGVDLNSSEMQVFQAVLVAAGRAGKFVNYKEIASSLEKLADRRYTKAYIYRRLNDLEEREFITVDDIHSPRTYAVLESGLSSAFETLRVMKLSENLENRQKVSTMINRLNSVKSEELALMLHRQLAGTLSIKESEIIEGIENVRSTIIREFADGSKPGDVVRVLGHTSTLVEGLGPGGVTELRVMQAGFRGVKVMGLLTPVSQVGPDASILANHLMPMADIFSEASRTGNIHVRLAREPVNTYRIVSLNDDKMLLYLTHAKESDVAALVHRKDNAGLVDDAIRTFDELWEDSIDVLEMVNQLTKKNQPA
ncbi:MAG: hypothetical protein ACFFFK_09860 [Candidatus Thorarchaeota archaeon]